MAIAFTEDDDYPRVETVSDRIDLEEENEETASNAGSEVCTAPISLIRLEV
jgi:hypothetical protein